jgi:cyclophilin family peptidyl-prolyl cis-trans isomerase
LVTERYYDGILFHRVISGFMIQAGNTGEIPTEVQLKYGDNTGVNYTIPAEIVSGFTHKRGSLAAARTNNPEKASSGSQFYIVHTDNGAKHLDGDYTVFGEVIDGFDTIDKIAAEPTNRDRPIKELKILSITPVF